LVQPTEIPPSIASKLSHLLSSSQDLLQDSKEIIQELKSE